MSRQNRAVNKIRRRGGVSAQKGARKKVQKMLKEARDVENGVFKICGKKKKPKLQGGFVGRVDVIVMKAPARKKGSPPPPKNPKVRRSPLSTREKMGVCG